MDMTAKRIPCALAADTHMAFPPAPLISASARMDRISDVLFVQWGVTSPHAAPQALCIVPRHTNILRNEAERGSHATFDSLRGDVLSAVSTHEIDGFDLCCRKRWSTIVFRGLTVHQ